MKTLSKSKGVKEFKAMKNTEKDYRDLLDVRLAKMPKTLLDDDYADWENDNLVDK